MGKNDRKKKLNKSDLQRKNGELEQKKEGLKKLQKIVFGTSLLDNSQGQDYENWEIESILSKALSTLQGLCSMTMNEAKQQQIIKEYTSEIPEGSAFEYPKHISEDINWASIRVQGKVRIIGFVEENYIFQIVFLDKEHEFYPSVKRNT
jgi:hypothetical protein